MVQGFTRRCISNASAKLSTSFLARSGFQNPFSIFLHYSLKFSVFLCFSLFMAQKSNYIANGTRRWKRLRSVAVGRNDLWYKCRHVVMHSKSAPTGYRATLSESTTGVCIANRGCACGVPTAIDRVTPLGSFLYSSLCHLIYYYLIRLNHYLFLNSSSCLKQCRLMICCSSRSGLLWM